MEDQKAFGRQLRQLRKARDLTQEALAQQAYCAIDTIKKIEAGVRRPSRQLAAQFADCLALAGDERAAFLVAARAEIETDHLAKAAQPVDSAAPAPAIPLQAGHGPRALAPILVGRQAQLRELEEHLALASSGAGRVVFIAGDAGVGKTRLLREFITRVRSPTGAEVLEGHCYDERPASPYGPFVDALRAFARERGPAALSQRAGALADALAPLLPGLDLPAPRPIGDPQGEKRRLFEAIYRVILPPAAPPSVEIPRRCCVLVLEDLHWSDQSSQELLAHLARVVEHDPILVLGTYRGDELHRRHSLTHLLAQLTRERRYHEVPLPPLAHDELGGMLEATLERLLPGAFVSALYDRTEGNPFFVEEILKVLMEQARLDALIEGTRQGHGLAVLDIPRSLKESILTRTTDLDATTAEVLRYAAVIGRRFDFELLLELTDLAETDLLHAVAALVERQLVVEERGGIPAPALSGVEGRGGIAEDRYAFRHALTREAIYGEMLGRERRVRHRAVLRALEALYPQSREAVADQLAYHSLQAKELTQAAHYARLAGDQALHMYAYGEARAYYETALEYLETDDPREMGGLLASLAQATVHYDSALALRSWQEAQRHYAQLGDRHKVGEISYWLSLAVWNQGDTQAAFAHARAAIETLEAGPPGGALAMGYQMLSRLFYNSSRPRESIVWGEKALEMAEALGDDDVRSHALTNIGCSLIILGDTSRGLATLEANLELVKQDGATTPYATSRAYNNFGVMLRMLGEFRRAVTLLRECAAFHDKAGLDASFVWSNLGETELALGHWDQAHLTLDRAFASGSGLPVAQVQAAPPKGELLFRQGHLDEARRFLEPLMPAIERTRGFEQIGPSLSVLARIHLTQGDIDQAVAIMEQCVAAWRAVGPLVGTESLLVSGVEVYLRAGREGSARELLDALTSIAGQAGNTLSLACLADAQGLFAAREGRHAEATQHFRHAATRWPAMAAPFEEALSRRRLAESLLQVGDSSAREEAGRELATARETFARLGAPLELAAADALAERYGLAPRATKVPSDRKTT
jgi:transcriptional regulator with XRE-family HTH domain